MICIEWSKIVINCINITVFLDVSTIQLYFDNYFIVFNKLNCYKYNVFVKLTEFSQVWPKLTNFTYNGLYSI